MGRRVESERLETVTEGPDAAFVVLALRLRAEGAVGVRSGNREVRWAGAPRLGGDAEQPVPVPLAVREPLSEQERDELESLRQRAQMAEEIP